MTDALSDAIQGKPGPSSEVKAPFTTTDFGSTAKDVPVSDSHDLANGCAINPSDVEKPPTQTSPANGGTEGLHHHGEEFENFQSDRQSISSTIAKISNRIRRYSLQAELPSASVDAHDDRSPQWDAKKSHQPLGIPKSSYYTGPPGIGSVFGTDAAGEIGIHHPREIIRIERDYSAGELPQFHSTFPLELEGRITPTQFQEIINDINEILISANDLKKSAVYNVLAPFTLYLSMLFFTSHYNKEMQRLEALIDQKNATIYQPRGLRILWPRKTAFLFLEIEYY